MIMSRRAALRSLVGAGAGLALSGLPLSGLRESARVTAAGPSTPEPQARSRPTSSRSRSMEPFRIDFGREEIDDLHRRIDATRWPEMPFDSGWSAGTDEQVLRRLVEYWRSEYDWFEVQEELNRLDHRRGPVRGEDLHCVVYRAPDPEPGDGPSDPRGRLPLLLLHGWPGSFLEFGEAAELLVAGTDEAPGFDLVVPSLPGFVFSEPPREPGLHPGVMAERLHLLMGRLGHERYGIQGGDWGAIVGTRMALQHPEAVAGLHLNFATAGPPPPDGEAPGPEEREYRERRARFQRQETGYSAIQGTRPRTLAYAQHDSPVGWLAWILEKYWAWSDHGDDLWDTFERDDILTTAMLYWLPGRILSAARLYYETRRAPEESLAGGRVEVPTGYARFPAEPWSPPREMVERSYDLVHYSEPARGGHFPALEQPEIWAREVAGFFSSL